MSINIFTKACFLVPRYFVHLSVNKFSNKLCYVPVVLRLFLDLKLHYCFSEMRALGEVLGAYGVKYMCRKMMLHIVSQIDEIKVL